MMWDDMTAYNSGSNVLLSDGNFYQRTDMSNTFSYDNMPFNAGLTKIAFTNKHHWLGGILNYKKSVSDHIQFNLNYHFRYTNAQNFDRLADLLGADAYITLFDQNNFGNRYQEEYSLNIHSAWNIFKNPDDYDKLNFHYQSKINLHALFGGVDFKIEKWNFFTKLNVSAQQNQRTDFFNYASSDPNRTSPWFNQFGFSAMTGAKFSHLKHTGFFSVAYQQKPNRFENLFLNYRNDLNLQLEVEKAFSTELGYVVKTSKSELKVNFYTTLWMDKYTSLPYENPDTHQTGTVFLQGVNQRHFGLEAQWAFQINKKWYFNSMFSWGNWEYFGKATGNAFDTSQQPIGSLTLDLMDVKVGDAAQLTSFSQLNFEPNTHWNLFVNHQWMGHLYSKLNTNQNFGESIALPNYQLINAGLETQIYQSKKVVVKLDVSIQNALNEMYIAESHTNYALETNTPNWNGIALNNKVFFGLKRTGRVGLNVRF